MLFSWLNFTTLSQTNWEAKTQGGIIEVLAHIYKKKKFEKYIKYYWKNLNLKKEECKYCQVTASDH